MVNDVVKQATFLGNWHDEMEAIMLYTQMASWESNPRKKKIYQRLASMEKEHASIWEAELKKLGVKPVFRPRLKAQLLSIMGKLIGHRSLLEFLERGEAIVGYGRQVKDFKDQGLKKTLNMIIPDEKGHSKLLNELSGPRGPLKGERWHQGGGSIRDIVFGMNDGLLSTFSLIAGVAGGISNNSIVLLAGLAGAIAGAISMAAGAYVSTKAEKEVFEKHLQMEKSELETMPETEEEELALLYELKGMSKRMARGVARKILSNKEIALTTMAKEELGLDPEDLGDPLKAGIMSGTAFTLGAAVPVIPWVLLHGKLALYVSIFLSLGGFFLIGMGRTIVTGKNPWRSGLEMFIIGTVSAIITYLIGNIIGVSV